MPLDIQAGGFSEKVRRLMGVRGRMPLRLDEQVIPSCEVGPMLGPPYRISGEAYNVMMHGNQGSVAAVFPWVAIHLPATSKGALVVTDAYISNVTAADSYSLWLGNTADYIASQVLPATDIVIVENYPAVGGAGVLPYLFGGNLHGTNAALGIGKRVGLARMAADVCFRYKMAVTLRPGWALAVWRGTVNTSCDVSFNGTYYGNPDISAS